MIMIISGLEFSVLPLQLSICFHTVLYILNCYIIYTDALQENDYHNF